MNSPKAIAELAYQLWSERGRPHGSEEEDWIEAERQLAGSESSVDRSLKESFPASDPPASHTADFPPSNAADKWKAKGIQLDSNNPPVDETDDAPAAAPGDTGEG